VILVLGFSSLNNNTILLVHSNIENELNVLATIFFVIKYKTGIVLNNSFYIEFVLSQEV